MLVEHTHAEWGGSPATSSNPTAVALECGDVVWLPRLTFTVDPGDRRIFSADLAGTAKNVSYNPSNKSLGGTTAAGADAALLASMLERFSGGAVALARALLPEYAGSLQVARASFRPVEIEGRRTSWRKDDTRLHVDSFPSSPTGGRRILRVFTNVNPEGRPRTWRIGGPFEEIVARFRSTLRVPWPGLAVVLHALRLTKSRRTPYDALMLQLHDAMKRDAEYQASRAHASVDFPPGTTWMAFTDQVAHAAMRGQYQFEQTLLVPVSSMCEPTKAPLRVLERAIGRPLV